MEEFECWVEHQYRHSATAMLRSISPLSVIHVRPGFGQRIAPVRGAIVASPVPAAYDPEPDYFFHWYRDSAVIVDALRLLMEDSAGQIDVRAHFLDFVNFSLSLEDLDGRALVESPGWRRNTAPDFTKYLRTDQDLATVHGEAVAADTRVNADGTLDISDWPRPQHDGPAMRALTLLRWMRGGLLNPQDSEGVARLVNADLEFTRHRWREPCFDIWEEEKGAHYYTLRIAAAALEAGAQWLRERGELPQARACRDDAAAILRRLDGYWLPDAGYFRSRVLEPPAVSRKELDISVILAANHAAGTEVPHSPRDPRMHSTMARLEALFDADYAINHSRPPERAPAMGRYSGDVYFSGGAYYFSTLGAAEFHFRAAAGATGHEGPAGAAGATGATGAAGAAEAAAVNAHFERGDAFLATVRAFTPPSGDLSEQFDQRTGVQRSARDLAWSYAAFISCVAARRVAARCRAGPPRARPAGAGPPTA